MLSSKDICVVTSYNIVQPSILNNVVETIDDEQVNSTDGLTTLFRHDRQTVTALSSYNVVETMMNSIDYSRAVPAISVVRNHALIIYYFWHLLYIEYS